MSNTLIEQRSPSPSALDEILVEPGRGIRNYWGDLWRYRELFYLLAWRDLTVRYKQTVIGIAWTVIQPFLTMVVFTVVFNRLAHLQSEGSAPYPILVYVGLLPWTFFTTALGAASNSMIVNANMVSKVFFPRLILPASAVIVAVADFVVAFGLLIVLMVVLRFVPSVRIVTVPLFLLLGAFTALGSGLWFAALNVKYRDFKYVIPFMIMIGTYVSPVGFSSSVIPQKWQLLYSLNPMVGVIDGFRWAIIGGNAPLSWLHLGMSLLVSSVLFAIGLRYFYVTERTFADVI